MTRKTPGWDCIELKTDGKRFHYGRFILSPLMKGQAETIGIALRRALLGEVEGTRITRAKFENAPHEYSTIFGIEESVHEILMNLREIVLRSDLYGIHNASICARGPGCVTAQDIFLPPTVEIVDTAQHIANLTKPIDLRIELQIERSRGYRMRTAKNDKDGSYPIDAVFMPVRNVNYSIHSYGNENQEILFLEIYTDGSLTPREALLEASRNLIELFIPFLDAKEKDPFFGEERDLNYGEEDKQNESQGMFIFATPDFFILSDKLHNLIKKNKKEVLNSIFIDQLGFTRRTYMCLKRYYIHTLGDLFNLTHMDLVRMRINLRIGDIKRIFCFLEKHSLIDEPEPKNGF
uniref:RNA polymerase alpha subunit n=1 Tax=Sphaerocoryne affinis TaxID=1636236 RepID=UPI0022FD40EB|nr:RNA polymerase alpha subunit [Sphaerocoryne affinis]YP_010623546.1 RNA polymerase alpha subunit [Sphaerocoryne affinis]WBF97553.1 RNA polymerase alpha subunit [Sphaerocoryne affinis]WBF97604.1 RNA polymerase alpha subunit [Sphaerocoryne affinis]